jgi:heat shock protein HslJ
MSSTPRWLAASAAGVILMATGCSDSGASSDGPVGTWGETAEQSPQLVLTEDGSLTGTDGCNGLNGTWEISGDTVVFGPVMATMMACDGVDTWLSLMTTATVNGDTMTVMGPDGAEVGTLDRQPS